MSQVVKNAQISRSALAFLSFPHRTVHADEDDDSNCAAPFRLKARAIFAFSPGTFAAISARRASTIVQINCNAAEYSRTTKRLEPVNNAHSCRDQTASTNHPTFPINESRIRERLLYLQPCERTVACSYAGVKEASLQTSVVSS